MTGYPTPASYGCYTGLVQVVSVGTASFGRHTGHMATDTRATALVTAAAGFVGSELVKVLVARRHRVSGLTDSVEAAERVRRAGGIPVMGDLREPGPWQDEAIAEWVVHLVSPQMDRLAESTDAF